MVLRINLNFDCRDSSLADPHWREGDSRKELGITLRWSICLVDFDLESSGQWELLFTEAEIPKSSVVTTKWGITYIDLPENHTEGRTWGMPFRRKIFFDKAPLNRTRAYLPCIHIWITHQAQTGIPSSARRWRRIGYLSLMHAFKISRKLQQRCPDLCRAKATASHEEYPRRQLCPDERVME